MNDLRSPFAMVMKAQESILEAGAFLDKTKGQLMKEQENFRKLLTGVQTEVDNIFASAFNRIDEMQEVIKKV